MSILKKIAREAMHKAGLYPHRIYVSKKYRSWDELTGYLKVLKVFREWPEKDQPKLKSLKNFHSDKKRCFILGNGPSLNKTDLTLLKEEITFGFNAIYLLYNKIGFKTTYYIAVDYLFCEDRAEQINELDGNIKFFPIERGNVIKRDINTIFLLQEIPNVYPGFSKDISEHIFGGHTVTYYALQLAYYMGFKKVYLVGMDHNYVLPETYIYNKTDMGPAEITSMSDDPNHFHPDYFGKGFRYHDPEFLKMEAAHRKAREVFEADGREIYNSTIGGNLETYKRVDYSSLF